MTFALSRRAALAGLMTAAAAPAFAQTRNRAPALSANDQALVNRATAYLQGLARARGRFLQTDARGRQSSGDIYMQRPGKIRFDYESPTDLLVVSDGSQVSVHDKRLKTFDRFPLASTPLALFLAKEIRLDRGVRVTEVRRYADGFELTAQDIRRETPGRITLTFTDSPLRLKEWTVVDAQGQKTKVSLVDLTQVASLDPALFVLRDPRPNANRGRP